MESEIPDCSVENRYCTVGRGPVPRRAWDYRTLARDRPSRYGNGNPYLHRTFARDRPSRYGNGNRYLQRTIARDRPSRYGNGNRYLQRTIALRNRKPLLHRRAGACPPPCLGLPNTREGQALALRKWKPLFTTNDREGQALALRQQESLFTPNDREGQALALRPG